MAHDINTSDSVSGGGSVRDAATALRQSASFGGPIIPSLKYTYSYGTGDFQVNRWYLAKRTIANGAYDELNLTSGLTALGAVQAFTALKRVLVAIIAPNGTKKLRVGPQGRVNANQLWFQAATANFWEETFTHVLRDRPITGWPVVAATTDILAIHNPGAAPLDYAVWLLGCG